MEEWLTITLLLCIFGFVTEIRPSEPFVYEYLTGPSWWNQSAETVQQKVFPIASYAYLTQLAVVFLITDLCRYKPLIIVVGVSGIIIWSLLLWGKSLLELQILEVFYGTFLAADVAYYTYIYAKVPKEFYSQVTSYARAAVLAGRCLSGILAQTLIELSVMDYYQLNFITFGAMITATVWSILLPSVPISIYFHRNSNGKNNASWKERYKDALILMKNHFIQSFSNSYVLKWSLWWALATCGFIQVQSYMQPLWTEIYGNNSSLSLQNGAVEAILTLVGCFGALLVGVLKINWKKWGELILSICSIICGVVLIVSSQAGDVLTSYICYVIFGGFYHFVITIANSEVAKHILEDSYGLVFGFNTFISLVLQTIMVVIVVTDDAGFGLAPRAQHITYGVYHISIALLFIIMSIVSCFRQQHTLFSPNI